MKEWPHGQTQKVDQVIGAFFLVRLELWKALEGFDERFFVYFEEVDFALRARQRGHLTTFVAEASAFHAGGGCSEKVRGQRLFFSLRSRLQYGEKHYSKSELLHLTCITRMLEPLTRSLHLLLTGRWAELTSLAQGYRKLQRWNPEEPRATVQEKVSH